MSLLIGVPREVFPGEKRVATVPEVVEKLIKLGFRVAVEAGAGDAAQISDDAYRAAGAADRRRPRRSFGPRRTSCSRCARPTPEEVALLREGGDARQLHLAGAEPRPAAGARGEEGHRARDGQRAAHLARAEARRALLDGQHRRLPRGHRGRARVRPLLHRLDHRGGQGPAGEGVRHRRRRRGPRGHRHGVGPGRDRARQRHAAGGRRPDQVARRRVRRRSTTRRKAAASAATPR